jgi:hypothetical protein
MVLSSIEEVYGPQFHKEKPDDFNPFQVYTSLGENTKISCEDFLKHMETCEECRATILRMCPTPPTESTTSVVPETIETFIAYCAAYSTYDILLIILFVFILWTLLK